MNYIVYNATSKILRQVQCPPSQRYFQANNEGEFVMEGTANDVTQKIKNPGIAGKVVDKTQEEIEADNLTPPEIPYEQKPAQVTNKQWQDVRDKLVILWANKNE